ncbi:nuclear transport factor 2 family protein [Rhodococcus sp. HNM0569]|uniref:nuclear transport factor 2 family protein n=1 Tax=Rhodococcus sp. HNM0569 TaxID=2716340 RepID=UPI00146CA554|nr:nuclear transport factor 2 family protein [Rhodococcus sp. HNM0569]NLU83502.1 nuclear transport factor 2 family protein [Rhodococcus sp. HNM0569]
MSISEIATVLAWQDAVNANDIGTLLDLSSTDIAIGDASGAYQGLDTLRDWAAEGGLTLESGRMFEYDGIVVVEETETWGTEDHPDSAGALAFRVVDDQVVSVFRHPTLTDALEDTGLSEKDLWEG